MENQAFEEFFAEVEKYPAMWDSLELMAVAGERDGSLHLLGLHCTLSSDLVPGSEVLFDTSQLIMVRQVEPLARLRKVLNQVANGKLALGSRTVRVEGFARYEHRKWRGNGQGLVDTQYPHMLLYSHGRSVSQLVSESEISTMLLSYGYQDLAELTQEKLGFPVGSNYSTGAYFIAPIFLEAKACFADDRLRLELRCSPSISREDLRASCEITINSLGKRETNRDKIDLSDADRLDESMGFSLVKELDLLPQAESAMVWVFHTTRTEPLYALRAEKPASFQANPLWGATKLVLSRRRGGQTQDAEAILRQSLGLTNEVKDPDRLEAAVHTLLSCAGYNCIFTGRAWGTQGIDTVAFPSSPGSIVAISITTSNDIREKVRTMLPQLTKLRNEQGGLQVASVIVASVEPTEVLESDRTDAAGHRIGLLLRPQLSEILDALLNQPQDRLADVVESMLGFGRRGAPPY